MAEKKIGIKVADGSFYPILEEGKRQKKRLVLTTVNDNQENVQIDLYRGEDGDLEEAEYIGSLLVEHIEGAAKGEADIEVDIGIDEDGNLETTARDRASGESQSLSASLQDLSESGGLYEPPDFSFTEEEQPAEEVEEPSESDEEAAEQGEEPEEEEALDLSFGEEELEEEPEESDFSFSEEDESLFEEEPDFSTEEEPASESAETEELSETPDFDEETGEELEGLGDFEEESSEYGEEPDFGESEYGEEPDFSEKEEPEESEGWEDEVIEEETRQGEEEQHKRRPLLVGLLVFLTLALLGALLYLFIFAAGPEQPPSELEARENGEASREAEEGGEEAAGEGTEDAPEEKSASPGEAADKTAAQREAEEAEESAGETEATSADEADTAGGEESAAGEDSMKLERENGGVWYRIRWGDTLWELSSSFYDTPWLYNEIAEENRISNPDRIFAQDKIFIPENPTESE